MANYIATSCTDAYIKINNTSAKCGHHKAPASRVVSQKTRYLCIVMDFLLLSFLFFLLSTKKGVWEKSQGKTDQPEQCCSPQWKECFHAKGKRRIVLLSQCSGALSSSSFCSNGVKMYHILSRPALAKHLPWRLCWTLVGVLTGPQTRPWPGENWMGKGAVETSPKHPSGMERWVAFWDRLA